MWDVRRITDTPVELLRSATGQGPVVTRSLTADGELLVPYICLVDCSSNPLQLNVCSYCGQSGCESGGWVTLRSLGDALVLFPWFDVDDPDDLGRYAPPPPLKRRGAMIVRGQALDTMRSHLPALPPTAALPMLQAREAIRCLEFEAPLGVLGGRTSSISIDRTMVLACSEEDLGELLDEADALLQGLANATAPLNVHSPPGVPVELYLDGPNTPTWTPLSRLASGQLALHFAPSLDADKVA